MPVISSSVSLTRNTHSTNMPRSVSASPYTHIQEAACYSRSSPEVGRVCQFTAHLGCLNVGCRSWPAAFEVA